MKKSFNHLLLFYFKLFANHCYFICIQFFCSTNFFCEIFSKKHLSDDIDSYQCQHHNYQCHHYQCHHYQCHHCIIFSKFYNVRGGSEHFFQNSQKPYFFYGYKHKQYTIGRIFFIFKQNSLKNAIS
jgi:hypothetical protein